MLYTSFIEKIQLWPEGAPNDNGLQGDAYERAPGYLTNVNQAEIEFFYPSKPNGMTIVVCPGGAYRFLVTQNEGTDVACWLNSIGITAAVLYYRMPNTRPEVPISDLARALSLVRERQAKGSESRVGVMGFSAGGHLAAIVSNRGDVRQRPDFQILFYPLISFEESITHRGSLVNFVGKNYSKEVLDYYSPNKQVDNYSPTAFIVHSVDDKALSYMHSKLYYNSLIDRGISAQLHLYASGGHGWGMCEFEYAEDWKSKLLLWLSGKSIIK